MTLVTLEPRAIFLKTFKTASTSTEASFAGAILGLPVEHETRMQFSTRGFVSPRGKHSVRAVTRNEKVVAAGYCLAHRELWRSLGKLHLIQNHSTPDTLKSVLGRAFWESSTKVVCVRNPFDLVVSHFFWQRRLLTGEVRFNEFVKNYKNGGINSSLSRELVEGWKIVRFESLREDINRVLDDFGIPQITRLPRFKSEFRPKHEQGYRQFYGDDERHRIGGIYSDWIDAFGYEF